MSDEVLKERARLIWSDISKRMLEEKAKSSGARDEAARINSLMEGEILKLLELAEPQRKFSRERVLGVLEGIDKCEVENYKGWWETSEGALFGKIRLERLLGILGLKDER